MIKVFSVIMLGLLIGSSVQTCSCKAQQIAMVSKQSPLLNGKVIEGASTRLPATKKREAVSTFLMDLEIEDKKLKGYFKIANEFSDNFSLAERWCLTKEQVVQLGHEGAKQRVILLPNEMYGIETSCVVSGYLFHDLVNDEYLPRQMLFEYQDPVSGEELKEKLTGNIIFSHKAGSKLHYKFDLTWSNSNIESQDSIFTSNLSGTITKETKVNHQAVTYDLIANNMTRTQLNNFVGWWINCILPSF